MRNPFADLAPASRSRPRTCSVLEGAAAVAGSSLSCGSSRGPSSVSAGRSFPFGPRIGLQRTWGSFSLSFFFRCLFYHLKYDFAPDSSVNSVYSPRSVRPPVRLELPFCTGLFYNRWRSAPAVTLGWWVQRSDKRRSVAGRRQGHRAHAVCGDPVRGVRLRRVRGGGPDQGHAPVTR